jgi:PAS domain S-box-containing protein
LYESAPVGYLTVDGEDVIREANITCARMLGERRSYLRGWLFPYFIRENSRATYLRHRRKSHNPEEVESCELEMRRADGSFFHARLATVAPGEGDDAPGNLRMAMIDVSDRKEAEEALQKALRQKERLLHEIHHRVKNNLQVVISFLRLQARRVDDKRLSSAFSEAESRIRCMALVHESLYRSDDVSQVNLKSFIPVLAKELLQIYRTDAAVSLHVNSDDVILSIDQAVPSGLILNELISNSLKHAFPAGGGDLWVEAGLPEPGRVELRVRDNGVGLPEQTTPQSGRSLGLAIVAGLTEEQLGGDLDIKRGPGTEFIVRFDRA